MADPRLPALALGGHPDRSESQALADAGAARATTAIRARRARGPCPASAGRAGAGQMPLTVLRADPSTWRVKTSGRA